MKLELFYPLKPFKVHQGFAENLACSNPDGTGVVGSQADGTCPAGKVKLYPLLGMNKGHTGLDLYAPSGAILRAPHDGIVKELQLDPARGLGVGLITLDRRDMGEHGVHYAKTRQWHGKQILVSLGQKVKCGDPIMLADNTGVSAGDHNHFELKPVEYDAMGNHYNVFQGNGWFGAIDPLPHFQGMYAEDYLRLQQSLAVVRSLLEQLKYTCYNYFNSRVTK